MDPKQTPQTTLDPKLKEAYDRVMGTHGTPPQPSPAPTTGPSPIGGVTIGPAMGKPEAPTSPAPYPSTTTIPAFQPATPTIPTPTLPTTPAFAPTSPTPGIVTPNQPAIQPTPAIGVSPQPMAAPSPFQPMTPQPANTMGTVAMGAAQPQPAAMTAGAKSHAFVASKKKSAISPVILILAGVVFAAVYTVFWVKFFGVKIPFLP